MIEELTPERIRRELIEPLTDIISDLNNAARKLDAEGKTWKYPFVPVNSKLAKDAILDLQTFMLERFGPRMSGVEKGTYVYQSHHKARKKKK